MVKVDAIPALRTPEQRVAYLCSLVPPERLKAARAKAIEQGEMLRINTRWQALSYGDQWQAYAVRMEMQRDMSEALLADALAECERLRELIK